MYLPYECPPTDPTKENYDMDVYMCDNIPDTHPELVGVANPLAEKVLKKAWYFCLIGLAHATGVLFKMIAFKYIQEAMIKSMRSRMIASLLRQEIGYFDDPKNSAG